MEIVVVFLTCKSLFSRVIKFLNSTTLRILTRDGASKATGLAADGTTLLLLRLSLLWWSYLSDLLLFLLLN